MQRFDWLIGAVWRAVAIAGVVIGWLGFAPRYIELNSALLALIGGMVVVLIALVFGLARDVSDNFEAVEATVNEGVDDIIDTIED